MQSESILNNVVAPRFELDEVCHIIEKIIKATA